MAKDLRSRNEYFSTESISVYFREYSLSLAKALMSVDQEQIVIAHNLLLSNKELKGRIFVGGNGGSAAIADHLNCDFTKGTHTEKHESLKTHSLVGSFALFSALGNDLGYDKTFSYQLEMAGLSPGDVVILISSSGSSPNIVEAARYAKRKHAMIIGLSGFNGGELKELSDAKLHVSFNNYGVIEDCHQILMHVIAQYHYLNHG